MFCIELAGFPIAINNKFGFVKALCRNYLTEKEPIFEVEAEEWEIDREISADIAPEAPYAESIVVYRKIAERLPELGALVFHGAVISLPDGCYAFTARSGVGKTTHIMNWLGRFGDEVHILNGDKPILKVEGGKIFACGTPWQGKEDLGVNERQELSAIAFLERGIENLGEKISGDEGVMRLMEQVYIPKNAAALQKTLELVDKILSGVRLYKVFVNMDISSADTVRRILEGNNKK